MTSRPKSLAIWGPGWKLGSGVAPANQTEESEVCELPAKEPRTGSEIPFCLQILYKTPKKGVSGTNSGLLPGKFSNVEDHFLRFGLPELLLIGAWHLPGKASLIMHASRARTRTADLHQYCGHCCPWQKISKATGRKCHGKPTAALKI